jgi:hypothetical protein
MDSRASLISRCRLSTYGADAAQERADSVELGLDQGNVCLRLRGAVGTDAGVDHGEAEGSDDMVDNASEKRPAGAAGFAPVCDLLGQAGLGLGDVEAIVGVTGRERGPGPIAKCCGLPAIFARIYAVGLECPGESAAPAGIGKSSMRPRMVSFLSLSRESSKQAVNRDVKQEVTFGRCDWVRETLKTPARWM